MEATRRASVRPKREMSDSTADNAGGGGGGGGGDGGGAGVTSRKGEEEEEGVKSILMT